METVKQLRRQRKSSPTSQIQSSIKENSRTERVIADMLVAEKIVKRLSGQEYRKAAAATEENSSTAGANTQQQQQQKR